jgi:hypothetical protein
MYVPSLSVNRISTKLVLCAALVLGADFLFYREKEGWTLGLFACALSAAVVQCSPLTFHHRIFKRIAYACFGLVCALIESPASLAFWLFCFTAIGLALAPLWVRMADARSITKTILRHACTGWSMFFRDSVTLLRVRQRIQRRHGKKQVFIRHWLLPLGLSTVFILLFATANPIITGWMQTVQWHKIMQYISVLRLLFWVILAALCWSVLRPCMRRYILRTRKRLRPSTHAASLSALLFNPRSIFTSLLLFNGLFAVQNALDITFLWSHAAALPDGMTYAQYAHQGAYPLIVTALLAAWFVLVALKPHSDTEQMPAIRALVFAWVGQNIFLVFSSMLRLLGYIEEYSLTYLRIAALIWMMLVALGLMFIILRIRLQKSNLWLVNSNAMTLYATLYLCCFINFGSIIAQYNVSHAYEVRGEGVLLDTYYLEWEVGVAAIPSLRWFEKHYPDSPRVPEIRVIRERLQQRLYAASQDWRQWTLRNFRQQLFY